MNALALAILLAADPFGPYVTAKDPFAYDPFAPIGRVDSRNPVNKSARTVEKVNRAPAVARAPFGATTLATPVRVAAASSFASPVTTATAPIPMFAPLVLPPGGISCRH